MIPQLMAVSTLSNEDHILQQYSQWLQDRGYPRGTIMTSLRIAQKILAAYPDGLPSEGRDAVAAALLSPNLTPKSRRARSTIIFRFCDFLGNIGDDA